MTGNHAGRAEAERELSNCKNITLWNIPTNDSWIRDFGPMFVKRVTDGQLHAIDWRYNAWGEKYPPFDLDHEATRQICQRRSVERIVLDVVLEGGSIDGDGQGTVLVNETCVLHPNRNRQVHREIFDAIFARYLGAKKILWLTGGELAGDDTDGHIDQIARLIGGGRVVLASCHDATDPNFVPLNLIGEQLEAMKDAAGRSLEIVHLPLPKPIFHQGRRLPTSYCNFYVANNVVVMPTFGHREADETAQAILGTCFPDREVVGVDAVDLAWGLGAFHCITQQQPL